MQNIGFWTREDKLYINDYFDPNNKKIDLDLNIIQSWLVPLSIELKKKNILIRNVNLIDDLTKIDLVIFMDLPHIQYQSNLFKSCFKCKRKILIIEENSSASNLISQYNISKNFDYILTMLDDLVDNKKFFKFQIPSISIHENQNKLSSIKQFNKKKKLCCMIAWNKLFSGKKNTRSKKIEIINWFEKNYPHHFSLYGPKWDEFVFPFNGILQFLNYDKFRSLRKILNIFFGKKFLTWKGIINPNEKKTIINDHKFIFVLENSSYFNGYITDKLFEVFLSESVPIFLGAPNIEKYVPSDCYINLRKYTDISELYEFLTSMSEDKYNQYIFNIKNYLSSDAANIFRYNDFNRRILSVINLYN